MLITAVLSAASTRAKPLKVFILAGQPNREGHAEIATFDYIGVDPAPRHGASKCAELMGEAFADELLGQLARPRRLTPPRLPQGSPAAIHVHSCAIPTRKSDLAAWTDGCSTCSDSPRARWSASMLSAEMGKIG